MTTDRKMNGRASSIPGGLAIGTAVSMFATLIVTVISAHMISAELLTQDKIGYCSIAALILGTVLGAVTAANKVKHRLVFVCVLNGLVYYCVLLAITALFFGGQYQGMGVTLVVVTLGSIAAALIAGREGKQKPSHKRKKTHR